MVNCWNGKPAAPCSPQPGAGAAAAWGRRCSACSARLRPGIEIVTETLRLDEAVRDADLVITGEGRLDSQSIHGKTPIGVRGGQAPRGAGDRHRRQPDARLPVVHQHGIDAAFSVLDRIVTLEEALADADCNLQVTARNVAAVWQLAQRKAHRHSLLLLSVSMQDFSVTIAGINGLLTSDPERRPERKWGTEMKQEKHGVLLVNTGTPDAPTRRRSNAI